MAVFEEVTEAAKGDIAGVPVWGIAIGGAAGLFLITRVLGSGRPAGQEPSSPPASGPPGLTRDEYGELTDQAFETLGSDVNARFGDLQELISTTSDSERQRFEDFTAGLATTQAQINQGFQRNSTQVAAANADTTTRLTRIEGKVDQLARAEERRNGVVMNTLNRIAENIAKLLRPTSVPKQVVR